jgi:hypothetical protein
MLQTKFGDRPSIFSVGDYVKRFFIFSFKWANQINLNKLDKRLLKNATDKVW